MSLTEFDEEVKVASVTKKSGGWHIVVYNDDVNSFDHVIDCFCNILEHTEQQAEQCANIIHNKGFCSVKVGEKAILQSLTEKLCAQNLSASLESISA